MSARLDARRGESASSPGRKGTGMPPVRLTLPQAVCLLAYERGVAPKMLPALTRRALLRHRWIEPAHPGYRITEAGRQALAASPLLPQAQRALDQPERQPPTRTNEYPSGYRSDSVKRSGRKS